MTEDPKRFGGRLLAFAGLWVFLSGLLMAMSFVDVVLVVNAVLLTVVLVTVAVWALRRFEIGWKLSTLIVKAAPAVKRVGLRLRDATAAALGVAARALRIAGRVAARAARGLWLRLRGVGIRRHARRLGTVARRAAAGTPDRVNVLLERSVRAYAIAVYRLSMRTSQALERLSRVRPGPAGARYEALQLNEVGAQLRRQGDHQEAAERHRVALAIVRDLGDEQAEALTLNNLALALAQGGAEDEAVEHLEEALVVLRELGDEEHEGQVIANLGMVHRRQGHSEEAVNLLHEALDKLPPDSSAYRQIEEELRRAS